MAIQFETGASGQMVADASLSPSSVNKKTNFTFIHLTEKQSKIAL
jgi:hypothetical protein